MIFAASTPERREDGARSQRPTDHASLRHEQKPVIRRPPDSHHRCESSGGCLNGVVGLTKRSFLVCQLLRMRQSDCASPGRNACSTQTHKRCTLETNCANPPLPLGDQHSSSSSPRRPCRELRRSKSVPRSSSSLPGEFSATHTAVNLHRECSYLLGLLGIGFFAKRQRTEVSMGASPASTPVLLRGQSQLPAPRHPRERRRSGPGK